MKVVLLDFVERRLELVEQTRRSEAKIQAHVKAELEASLRDERLQNQVLHKEIAVILKVARD